MTALGKKGDLTLLAAVRRARDNGMTWDDFVKICAPEFGAVLREGRVSGWVKPHARREESDEFVSTNPDGWRLLAGDKMVSDEWIMDREDARKIESIELREYMTRMRRIEKKAKERLRARKAKKP